MSRSRIGWSSVVSLVSCLLLAAACGRVPDDAITADTIPPAPPTISTEPEEPIEPEPEEPVEPVEPEIEPEETTIPRTTDPPPTKEAGVFRLDAPPSVAVGEVFEVVPVVTRGGVVSVRLTRGGCGKVTNEQWTATEIGACRFAGVQVETERYTAGTGARTVQVAGLSPALSLEAPPTVRVGGTFDIQVSTDSDGTLAITSQGECEPTAERRFAATAIGTCVIEVVQQASATHEADTATKTVQITKIPAGLTLVVPPSAHVDEVFTVEVRSDSTGEVTVTAAGSCTPTATDNRFRATSTGSCVLSATQDSTDTHDSGQARATVAVGKISGEIVVNGPPGGSLQHPASFPIEAWPIAGGPVTIGRGSGSCSAPGPQDNNPGPNPNSVIRSFRTGSTGTCTIVVTQAETPTHTGTSQTLRYPVTLPSGDITLTGPSSFDYDQSGYYNDINLTAGLIVGSDALTVSVSGDCRANETSIGPRNFTVLATGPGSCEITVTQADNAQYLGDTETHTVTINKPQGSFNVFVEEQVPENQNFPVDITVYAGGDVNVQVQSGPCTKVNATTFRAGEADGYTICILRAVQEDSSEFSPGTPTNHEVSIQDLDPSTTTTTVPTTTIPAPTTTGTAIP